MKKPTLASQIASIVFIAVTVGVVTTLVYVSGTSGIAVHCYYIPIIYAGYAFGDYGAIIVSMLCATLCGPWMPAEISRDSRIAQGETDILVRALIFYVIAIAASRTSLELKRRIGEARTLYEVARNITSSLRLQEVLGLITKHALTVMDAKACAIRLLDRESTELKLAAQHGLSEDYAKKGSVSLSGSEMDRIVIEGNVLQIADVRNDPKFQYPEEARQEGIASVLSVPLVSKDAPLGVIRVYSERPRRFRAREIELLRAFADQAALAIENAELYEDLRKGYYETVRALTIAIEAKDSATYSHSERVTELAAGLASRLGVDGEDLDLLRFGAILHDIGKIGVAEHFLDSPTGSEETQIFYRMHPLIGRSILQPISFLAPIMSIVVSHHENWDGSGFPEGLSGKDIPHTARIVAVADRYERLVNPDTGGTGLSSKDALLRVVSEAGSRFDPEIVGAFHSMMKQGVGPEQALENAGDDEPAAAGTDAE